MKENKDESDKATADKEEEKIVLIKVTWKTRELLKQRGIKGETYEDIICDLLEATEEEVGRGQGGTV